MFQEYLLCKPFSGCWWYVLLFFWVYMRKYRGYSFGGMDAAIKIAIDQIDSTGPIVILKSEK